MKRLAMAAVALVCALTLPALGAAQDEGAIGLEDVLARAREYVAAYERGLRTIIGEEEYLQEAEWRTERQNGLATTWRIDRTRRQLSSDFLMVPIDGRWFGVRQVHQVDGLPVESDGDLNAFRSVVGSPAELLTTWPDNVQYNIGSFQRTFNVPTFALNVLRPSNAGRFEFAPLSEARVDGVDAWEIRFSEIVSPTLVQGVGGEDRFARGRLWIRPENGEVRASEIEFEMTRNGSDYTAHVRVDYAPNTALSMLVPDTMRETYRSTYHAVHTTAVYSNFKRFETGVTLDFGAVEP